MNQCSFSLQAILIESFDLLLHLQFFYGLSLKDINGLSIVHTVLKLIGMKHRFGFLCDQQRKTMRIPKHNFCCCHQGIVLLYLLLGMFNSLNPLAI